MWKSGSKEEREVIEAIAKCRQMGKQYKDIIQILNAAGLKTSKGLDWSAKTLPSFMMTRRRKINSAIDNPDARVKTIGKCAKRVRTATVEKPRQEARKGSLESFKETVVHILTDPNLSEAKRMKVLLTYLQ